MPESADGGTPLNRRVHPRVPILVRETRCIAGMEVFFGQAINISRGGLFIATSAPKKRKAGETFEIEFELPGCDRVFRCQARVMWIRSFRRDKSATPGFGLQFLDLTQEDGDAIEAWILNERARA
jgi:uncharacterized protein (TIGR02266 family)